MRQAKLIALTSVFVSMASWPCLAQSLDDHLTDIKRHVRATDWQKAVGSAQAAAGRLKELYNTANKITGPAKQVAAELNRGLKAFAGEPTALDALVEMINKDIAQLNSRDVNVPDFGDPMKGAPESALTSSDPKIRGAALDELRRAGEEKREAYQSELDQLKEERAAAQKLYEEAQAAVDRGVELEKALETVNNSAAGLFLNIGGGKVALALLDMTAHVNPALSGRESAAGALVKKYDAAINTMEGKLRRYGLFAQWATYYRWQEWVRENAPFSAELEKAKDLLNKIDKLGSAKANGPTPQTMAIAELLKKTVAETGATQEQAAKLLEEAQRKDAAAAADAEFRAMLGLAGAVAGGVSSSTSQPKSTPVPTQAPPIIIKNTTTIFNFPLQTPVPTAPRVDSD
ncbi:hypothetical protein CN186_20175 [Sinorhizobium medicae]|uniref:hypothetical protein n=1 Tax=Sinorhizobium medicae TaxID=110321 RepID=UPI000FDBF415|nr:hypothetical protein [Sinorhizobium medicae]MDW9959474.1 hypothetical protein [Sinorhizobium meliloti]RVI91876.1 hypothetical protein CN186_20175 [Sinorhizobium medicae]